MVFHPMDYTRIYLVRHGQVAPRWQGRIYGDMDVELSPYGEAQAREAAARLRSVELAAVFSSGLQRAVYGARSIASGRDLDPDVEAGVREMNRGSWRGLTFAELEEREPGAWAAWFAAPRDRRAPGGESLGELAARVHAALDRLAAGHAGQAIAVVSHSWPIRVSAALALGLELEASVGLELSTGEIAVVDWPADRAPRAPVAEHGGGATPRLSGFGLDRPPGTSPWFRSRPDSLNR